MRRRTGEKLRPADWQPVVLHQYTVKCPAAATSGAILQILSLTEFFAIFALFVVNSPRLQRKVFPHSPFPVRQQGLS
jgi:hypothetical protein